MSPRTRHKERRERKLDFIRGLFYVCLIRDNRRAYGDAWILRKNKEGVFCKGERRFSNKNGYYSVERISSKILPFPNKMLIGDT